MVNQKRQSNEIPNMVLGVGASAGGLNACKQFLSGIPSNSGLTIIIIMHLDPEKTSHIAEIFQSATELTVSQVQTDQALETNHVYVIAPGTTLKISGNTLNLKARDKQQGERNQIDHFFTSLAEDRRERAFGILLSGTGSDGSEGLKAIHEKGGTCLVQKPETAEYSDMAKNAISHVDVDGILPPEEMGDFILKKNKRNVPTQPENNLSPAFAEILTLLGNTYGISFFNDYKRGTLERRMQRRMDLKQITTIENYREYLRDHPKEVTALYEDLLVGVTQFFRDPEVWSDLEAKIIPDLISGKDGERTVRVWVPGCATGEEAYGIAILFLEELEKLGDSSQLKVFATDVAKKALAYARDGIYPQSIQENLSSKKVTKYFIKEGEKFKVSKFLRSKVTFAEHNLLVDPPFTDIDLISCRNTLIYMKNQAQHKVLETFHFALRPNGILVLGPSETIGQHESLFTPLSQKHKIYHSSNINKKRHYQHLGRSGSYQKPAAQKMRGQQADYTEKKLERFIEQFVLNHHTDACVAITESFEIHSFYGPVERYLKYPTGESRMGLMAWARPEIYSKLRSSLEEVKTNDLTNKVIEMQIRNENSSFAVECKIEKITPSPQDIRMFLVSFRDAPTTEIKEKKVPHDHDSGEDRIRNLEYELKNTQEQLKESIQQLENTNEEYQAEHEELLSLNEELQSSNEELEASKEELQSLNEELTTVNQEVRQRNQDLREIGNDLDNLLVSTNIPIIFLSRDLKIRRFTPASKDMLHVTNNDIGRSIKHIKTRFDDSNLIEDNQQVLDHLTPITREIESEDGRQYKREILPYRTDEDQIDGTCITFHDITEQKQAAQRSEQARLFAEAIVDTSQTSLLVLDSQMNIVSANESFCDTFQVVKAEVKGKKIYDIGNQQWDIPILKKLLEEILPEKKEVRRFEVEHTFENIGKRYMSLNAHRIRFIERPLILLGIEDITEQKNIEKILKEHAEKLEEDHKKKDEFLAMLSHEIRNPLSTFMTGLELIEYNINEPEKVEEAREMMSRQANRIIYLLNELLEISRLTSGKIQLKWETVDLIETIQPAIEAVRPLINKHQQELITDLPGPQKLYVQGDIARLTQVIENILSNSSKYTQDGGKIWLSLTSSNDWASITICDNGEGMSSDLLPHIFEVFTQGPRTLERSEGGMGLGLPLVKGLVEKHGGSITATSPGPGKGSEFTLHLPLVSPPNSKPDDEDTTPAQNLKGKNAPRILIVDDEKEAAYALKIILQSRGHEVETAQDGKEALNKVSQFRPNLVLLDLGLPKLDGYEVAKNIREDESNKNIVLIAMTGYRRDDKKLDEAGIDEHVIKPIDKTSLFELIDEKMESKES